MVLTRSLDARVEALEKAVEKLNARMDAMNAYSKTQFENIIRLLTTVCGEDSSLESSTQNEAVGETNPPILKAAAPEPCPSNSVVPSRPHPQALLVTTPLSLQPVYVAAPVTLVELTIMVVSKPEIVTDVNSLPSPVLGARTNDVSFPSSVRHSIPVNPPLQVPLLPQQQRVVSVVVTHQSVLKHLFFHILGPLHICFHTHVLKLEYEPPPIYAKCLGFELSLEDKAVSTAVQLIHISYMPWK